MQELESSGGQQTRTEQGDCASEGDQNTTWPPMCLRVCLFVLTSGENVLNNYLFLQFCWPTSSAIAGQQDGRKKQQRRFKSACVTSFVHAYQENTQSAKIEPCLQQSFTVNGSYMKLYKLSDYEIPVRTWPRCLYEFSGSCCAELGNTFKYAVCSLAFV